MNLDQNPNFKSSNPFKTPEDYFQKLEGKMVEKVKEEQKVKKLKPKFHHPVWYGTAATMLILIGVYVFLPTATQNQETTKIDEWAWVEEKPGFLNDISEEELATLVYEQTTNTTNDTINFLLKEEVEMDWIYEELANS